MLVSITRRGQGVQFRDACVRSLCPTAMNSGAVESWSFEVADELRCGVNFGVEMHIGIEAETSVDSHVDWVGSTLGSSVRGWSAFYGNGRLCMYLVCYRLRVRRP